MEFETKDLTIEDLANYAKSITDELKARYYDLSGTYKDVWESYGNLDEDYKRLQSRYNKLKEDNEKLKQQGKEFSGYIELNSYGEGIKKGEQLMQERVDKIIDYWVNNPSILTQWFGGETTLFQLLEKTKQTCERIEYETEKEQEIHVGDEVVDKNGKKYVVSHLVGVFMYAMASSGASYTFTYSDVSKTGKHYPLEEILKELE